MPLLQPQNTTHFMFIPLQVHVLVLIHDVGHLHGGGRSSGLHGTGSITGVMPTSVALYPYCSGSGVVTAGVGACNHILHCRYARFMCSPSVDEQHTSWLKSSSFLALWYCSQRYSSNVEQSVFFNPDTRNFSALLIICGDSSSTPNPSSRERSMDAFMPDSFGPTLLVLSHPVSA